MCGVQVRSGFPLILDHPGRTQIRLRADDDTGGQTALTWNGWMDPRREATKETHRKHEMPRAIRAAGGGPIEAAVTGELEGGMFSFSNCEVSTFIPR
jgi:hypothetical protein